MLESLKRTGRRSGHELGREWEQFSQGWRELLGRSGGALTHFTRAGDRGQCSDLDAGIPDFPQWNLLAAAVEEITQDILVRIDVPGMDKDDCSVTIEDNVLFLKGERHVEREQADSAWHLTERAYGTFRRAIPLPRGVVLGQVTASYRNGMPTLRLPKASGSGPTVVRVS